MSTRNGAAVGVVRRPVGSSSTRAADRGHRVPEIARRQRDGRGDGADEDGRDRGERDEVDDRAAAARSARDRADPKRSLDRIGTRARRARPTRRARTRNSAAPSSPELGEMNTRTGQCQRYSEYERKPIATSQGARSISRDGASRQRHDDRDDRAAHDREHEKAAAVQRVRVAVDATRIVTSDRERAHATPTAPARARRGRVRTAAAPPSPPTVRRRRPARRARRRRAIPSRASRCRDTRVTDRRSATRAPPSTPSTRSRRAAPRPTARIGCRTIDAPGREAARAGSTT